MPFGLFLGIAAGILLSGKGGDGPGDETPSTVAADTSGATEGPQGYGIYEDTTKTVAVGGFKHKNVTKYRTSYTGFSDATICRPKFIFFRVTGLRPNTRHFAFFDKVNVTNYINVDLYNYDTRAGLDRNSLLRNPGEKYRGETGFPADFGGPSSVMRSDDAGTIEGCFYLQSNNSINFPTGNRQLVFLDISSYKPNEAISYAVASFTADGGIENYLLSRYQKRVRYWDPTVTAEVPDTKFTPVDKPVVVPPVVDDTPIATTRSSDDNDPPVTPVYSWTSTDKNGTKTYHNSYVEDVDWDTGTFK